MQIRATALQKRREPNRPGTFASLRRTPPTEISTRDCDRIDAAQRSGFADPGDEDDSADGRRDAPRGGNDDEYEEEFRVGNCKVEREWERDGEYREDRECDQDD